ncbi:GNAT family N-acetyltransferase [Kribbella shirazensis]|uniref:Ribosomal protein S18 acetylase RimI-like enzyme n=1 Tax=Kribbella shirazensis TaxID=1105143 RepID=A0A7X5VFU7_9ACTN|nr:GNAT family N-acetyltransferase [Kribbella shirazensis]NIK60284.1 ribosomal protein S18 acetylase RimI-like enzyme [Kribbella shirazensis]
MVIELRVAGAAELGEVLGVLRGWQREDVPLQLHPGDLGWFWRFGVERTAAATRIWRRGGEIVAIGMLDEPDWLRLSIAPDAQRDEELAQRIVEDVSAPAAGVLIEGKVYVETPMGALVQDLLFKDGWNADVPWVPLRRDLGDPVPDPGLRVGVIGAEEAHERTGVQRASFDGSTFTDERWFAMSDGLPYADARCLVLRNKIGESVAAATVWSAGEGRPGYIEPMGVHRLHRGRGYGTAMVLACARALQELGSSSIYTVTPATNVGAIATYQAAGMQALDEIRAQYRDA